MGKMFELSNSMHFLLVDDNEGYRIAISTALRKLGFWEIQIASTSMQALKILKRTPIDFVICDRNMPVVDGAQILKEIRESFEIRGTPFLMLGSSARVTRDDIVLLAEYEIDGYLTKPFRPKTLIEKITQCVENYRNPRSVEYNISLGKDKLLKKQYEAAMQMFESLLLMVPDSARIRVCIARCHKEQGDFISAIEYCQMAIQKNPLYAQAHDEMGKIFLAQKDLENAVECFKKGIAVSPKYPPRYEQIIDTLLQQECYAEAAFILEKAFENDVELEEMDFKYGRALFHMRKYEKAAQHLENAVRIDPNNKSLLNMLGICLKDLGRSDAALKHYNAAIKRYPEDTKLLFNKALCLISLVRYDQAKKILKMILSVEPDNVKVAAKLEKISQDAE